TFVDPEGDSLTYSAYLDGVAMGTDALDWINFDPATGAFGITAVSSHVGQHTVTVQANDGVNTAAHTFALEVKVPVDQGVLLSHLGQLTDYVDTTPLNGVQDFVTANAMSLAGSYQAPAAGADGGLLHFGSASVLVSRGNLLAVTDGNAATVGQAPQLKLSLVNVPVLAQTRTGTLQIALTRGLDSVQDTGESRVSVLLNVEMLNVGGQLVIRAVSQSADVQVSSSSISAAVPLNFSAADVIASSTGSGADLALNLNVFALLGKLDGTIYGNLLGSLLSDGTYTLSIEQQGVGTLPLLGMNGQPLDGFTVTLGVSSATPNLSPALTLGSDLAAVHVALAPGQTVALGAFLLSGGGTDSGTGTTGGARLHLGDPENQLQSVWLVRPDAGSYGLRDAQGNVSAISQYQLFGGEQVYALAQADLSRLVYLAPTLAQGASEAVLDLRLMLQDAQNNFSPMIHLGLNVQTALADSGLFTEGTSAQTLLTVSVESQVMALPDQGQLSVVRGGQHTALQVGDLLQAGDVIEYLAPSVGQGTAAQAGALVLREFNNASDTYSFHNVALQINHLPQISVTGTAQTVVEDAQVNSTSVNVSVSDVDTTDTLAWQSTGWSVGAGGVLSQALTYGSVTLTAGAQAGQYTLSYTLDAALSQSLGAGAPVTQSVTLQLSDGQGGVVSKTLDFAVQGVNDAATFAAVDANTNFDAVQLTEGDGAVTGRLVVSDVDSSTAVVAQAGTVGLYGTFAVAANGAWTYTPNGALNALKAQSYTDSFTVVTADGSSHG
ncbi:MAG: VCBS domain-containing protein, partial [Flavobacterium sp.]